jgi:hypothetical protein
MLKAATASKSSIKGLLSIFCVFFACLTLCIGTEKSPHLAVIQFASLYTMLQGWKSLQLAISRTCSRSVEPFVVCLRYLPFLVLNSCFRRSTRLQQQRDYHGSSFRALNMAWTC